MKHQTESYLLKKEQCPECAKLGKDRNHDNLALYSDGHSYCFSCGYTNRIWNSLSTTSESNKKPYKEIQITLPIDCDTSYPANALKWISQYELSSNDLLSNNVLWSEQHKRLIFPIYGDIGLLAYQGRYFGSEINKPKWWGQGDLANTFHIIKGRSLQPTLILTEDIVSAIKVSRYAPAMPLFGCSIGIKRFKRLYKLLGYQADIKIWLDPDKRKEAIKESRKGTLCGLKTSVIISNKDPKEESYETIRSSTKINN